MVLRNLAKIAIAATEAVGKAFARAVKDELKTSQHAANRYADQAEPSTSRTSQSDIKDSSRLNSKLGITLQESMQILDVKSPLDPKEIEEKYKHLFAINEKAKGGTLYLQAKVYRAKERIDAEIERTNPTTESTTAPEEKPQQ
uniref:Mitochondrial import inner membrane translocase subunit tim-16 n=1 Tax=Acrobeloides nanus TaxID=290746 RepID=A0A914D0R8_9BILA